MTRPSAVVVGAGLMGRWHAHALRRIGVRIAGVVDPDPSRARRLARTSRAAPFDTLEAGLAHGRPDAVHICTPPETHVPLARTALDAGCHVLVEKPLGPDARQTEALLSQAERARLLLCPVHQLLFLRSVRRAAELIAQVGPVLHVDAVACSAGGDGLAGLERDTLAWSILPHALSLIHRLLAQPIGAIDWSVTRPEVGEWRVAAQIGIASVGVLVSLAGRPTRHTLQLIGARGTLHIDLFHDFLVREPGRADRGWKVLRPVVTGTMHATVSAANLLRRSAVWEPAYPGLRQLCRAFYAAVAGSAPPPISPRETLEVARAADGIAHAAGIPSRA